MLSETMYQGITSEASSVRQVPRLHKLVDVAGKRVLDYGCGKYDDWEEYLLSKGAAATAGWDPWNRDPEANVEAAVWVYEQSADIVLCSNVLNVLKGERLRAEVIRECRSALSPGSGNQAFFTVYAGDRSGIGKRTSKGWQENRPLKSYFMEVRPWFDEAVIRNNVIIGTRR